MTGAQRIALAALAATIVAAYSWRLASDPIYLSRDEVLVALDAHAMAQTGHSGDGTFLPLYWHMGHNSWASPMRMYVSALVFRVAHISEGSSRVPSLIGGLAAIAMLFVAARRIFGSAWYGMLAAALLALMPAEFLASRFKFESHYPLVFIAGWLWCARGYEDTGSLRWLWAAGAMLGLGLYSYHAGPIMMPLYVALTLWLLWRRHELRADRVGALLAGFALCAVPFVVFALTHPEYLQGELTSYRIYDAGPLGRMQGVARLLNWTALTDRITAYYEYFNPSLLFFSGGALYYETTRQAGALLLPMAILLPAGARRILAVEPRSARLYLIGLVTGPLAASLVIGDGVVMRRALFMLPFAAIVAVHGFRQLIDSRARWRRAAGVLLLIALPVQFADFYRDYLGDYRTRSAPWLQGNMRGAFEAAIEAESRTPGDQPIFISTGINEEVDRYWMFYLLKHDRSDLAARTTIFTVESAADDQFPQGAIIICDAASAGQLAPRMTGLTEIARPTEPDGTVSFRVWVKDGGRRVEP